MMDKTTLDEVIVVYDDMVRRGVAYVRLIKCLIFDFPYAENCRISLDNNRFILTWPAIFVDSSGKISIRSKNCLIPDIIIDCDACDLIDVLKTEKENRINRRFSDWQEAFEEEMSAIFKADMMNMRQLRSDHVKRPMKRKRV